MNIYEDKAILRPGQVHCKKCFGTGFIQKRFTFRNGGLNDSRIKNYRCADCSGTGKFDWIEVVVGKKDRNHGNIYDIPEYNL